MEQAQPFRVCREAISTLVGAVHQERSSTLPLLPEAPSATFSRDRSGSVSVLAVGSILTLMVLIGAALDYDNFSHEKVRMQAAADAAALAVAKQPDLTDALAAGLAQSMVAVNVKGTTERATLKVTTTRVGGAQPKATVSVETKLPNRIMSMFGFKTVTVSVAATASVGSSNLEYTNLYAAIDLSASFSLGADATQRAALQALTKPYLTGVRITRSPNGCEFACHSREGWEPAGTTTYQMAKNAGIIMREDTVHSAFGSFVDTYMAANNVATGPALRQMSVFGFSADAQLLLSASQDVNLIKTATDAFPSVLKDTTNFGVVMTTIASNMGKQGDGLSKATAKKSLLLVTDGMEEIKRGDVTTIKAIDTKLCDTIKNAGIPIAVLEVKYLEEKGDYYFDLKVSPTYSTYSPALKNCASPGLYFQATDSDAAQLASMFTQIYNTLTKSLSLTN